MKYISAGVALANQSMWKTPLSVAGEKFEHVVGIYAESIFYIKSDRMALFFKVWDGIAGVFIFLIISCLFF